MKVSAQFHAPVALSPVGDEWVQEPIKTQLVAKKENTVFAGTRTTAVLLAARHFTDLIKAKAVPQHAMEELGGRRGIAPTHP
jgi:hypothetical protein